MFSGAPWIFLLPELQNFGQDLLILNFLWCWVLDSKMNAKLLTNDARDDIIFMDLVSDKFSTFCFMHSVHEKTCPKGRN